MLQQSRAQCLSLLESQKNVGWGRPLEVTLLSLQLEPEIVSDKFMMQFSERELGPP